MQADQAFGRLPDGGSQWALLTKATPGAPNDSSRSHQTPASPLFSQPSGFYDQPLLLELQHVDPAVAVFYTLDGRLPDSTATVYSAPFFIDTTTVVRAAAFSPDGAASQVVTATFIVNESFQFPVISLTTDPHNLWDPQYGIYAKGDHARDEYPYKGANFWREWERPVHVEFFETDRSLAFSADAGVRIFGHSSVGAPFKPLAIYARKKYGLGAFKHQIFPNKEIKEFEVFMLRNSGNDWNRTLFRDALMHELASEIHIPGQAYRPAIVFLNGAYWGIHNLRERMNEHYIASNFHVNADDIDLTAWNYGFQVYAGDSLAYAEMRNYVRRHDLSIEENYQHVASLIDIDNFIDYFIVEIFCNNRDWPNNNQYQWRPRSGNGRWMWLLKDMDHGFGYQVSYDYNSLVRNALKDDLFPYLLENDAFRIKFINRFAFLMNTIFQPDHLFDLITRFKTRLEPEMPRHLQRWAGVETYGNPPTTMSEWNAYCDELYRFAEHRLTPLKEQLRDYFHLGEMVEVSINVDTPEMGSLQIENETLPSSPWGGEFFAGVPLSIEAKAYTGYRFAGWDGVNAESDSISFTPQENMTITAKFDQLNSQGVSVVINEINYHSEDGFDVGDWIELANPTQATFDLNGWTLSDEKNDHVFTFPKGTTLKPNSYLVICRNRNKFRSKFPSVSHLIGDLTFGLSSKGDAVRLFDNYGLLVDAVFYGVKTPWPQGANGKGASLALIHPFADNAEAKNWFAFFPHGTPGRENIRFAPVDIHGMSTNPESLAVEKAQAANVFRFENFPNPFNASTIIRFNIPNEEFVDIKIYNLRGQLVTVLASDQFSAGAHDIAWRVGDQPSGLYFCKIETSSHSEIRKITLQK